MEDCHIYPIALLIVDLDSCKNIKRESLSGKRQEW